MSDLPQGARVMLFLIGAMLLAAIWAFATQKVAWDERIKNGTFEWKGTIYKVEKVKP